MKAYLNHNLSSLMRLAFILVNLFVFQISIANVYASSVNLGSNPHDAISEAYTYGEIKSSNWVESGHNGRVNWALSKSETGINGEVLVYESSVAAKTSTPTGKFYSVAHEMTLSKNLYSGGSYYQHFKAANKSLVANMDAATMSKLNIQFHTSKSSSILWGRSPKNWVWHHDVGKGVMQLVPKTQHTSGSIFWNTLHPNGVGGMHIWNK